MRGVRQKRSDKCHVKRISSGPYRSRQTIVNIMNKEPKITSSEMGEIVRNESNTKINSITVRRTLKATVIEHLTIERRKEQ